MSGDLIRQAGGFAGFLTSRIAESGCDSAIAQANDRTPTLVDCQSAGSTASGRPLDRQDTPVVYFNDILKLKQLDIESHIGVVDIAEPLAQPLVSVVGTRNRRFSPVSNLDFRITQVWRGVSCAQTGEPAADGLHVLLRHRPRSIPRKGEGRDHIAPSQKTAGVRTWGKHRRIHDA